MHKCNIDQSGRVVRFIVGVLMFFCGTIMFVASVPGTSIGSRILQAAIVFGGIFILYEGVMGWCALRAMGFKTKF